ncbi:MAG: hypothetical protein R3F05_17385 [Planctomycetota bacterium]
MTEDEPELIDELAEDYVRRLRAGEAVTPEVVPPSTRILSASPTCSRCSP